MRKFIKVNMMIGVMILILSGCASVSKKSSAESEKKPIYYKCVMGHYISDKQGKCPKCGMELQQHIKLEGQE